MNRGLAESGMIPRTSVSRSLTLHESGRHLQCPKVGVRHTQSAPGRNRTCDTRFARPLLSRGQLPGILDAARNNPR